MRRRKIPAATNVVREGAPATSESDAQRMGPVIPTKGRLRKCGPIVLIAFRVSR
jgi:hypothetical protein